MGERKAGREGPLGATPDALREASGIRFHYDLPVDFFRLFLDPTLSYSCHYFLNDDDSLAQAALNKLELVARKIALRRSDRVLDIGCGWGAFTLWAAERAGCYVTATTLSPVQAEFVRATASERGLEDHVDVQVVHANEMTFAAGSFDKIVTVGMIEHVPNLEGLWRDCRRLLSDSPDACLLIQGMAVPVGFRRTDRSGLQVTGESEFISDYIFPVGQFVHLHDVLRTLECSDFEVIGVQNITDHYTKTSLHWYRNLASYQDNEDAWAGVDGARFRAQLVFLAGCVETFAESRLLCYQTLARKLTVDSPRTPLPPTGTWEAGARPVTMP